MAAYDNFRANLATAIAAGGLKKSHIADALKTSRSYLDEVLKGQTDPSLSKCEQLARAVGLPIEALLVPPAVFSESLLHTVR